MKFATDRPYSDPAKAARKLVEIANSIEPAQETSRSALISSAQRQGAHPAMTRVKKGVFTNSLKMVNGPLSVAT
jgi:hypothetical protein